DDRRRTTTVAGACLQPEWLSDSELMYADDPDGRWTLQRLQVDGIRTSEPVPSTPADADTGYGLWVLGNRWYQPLSDGRIVAVRTNGSDEIVLIERDGSDKRLDVPATAHISVDDAFGSRVLLSGGGAGVNAGLWCVDVESGVVEPVRGGHAVDDAWMRPATRVTFEGPNGPVHAFDYAPANPDATAPAEERPPYIVFVHGGPT